MILLSTFYGWPFSGTTRGALITPPHVRTLYCNQALKFGIHFIYLGCTLQHSTEAKSWSNHAAPFSIHPSISSRHVKISPHSASSIFRAIASIDQHPSFLPFPLSAVILRHDAYSWPARATLTIGYELFNLQEDWASIAHGDGSRGIVRPRVTNLVPRCQFSRSRRRGGKSGLQTARVRMYNSA
jgi:hypothetical protein